MSTLIALKRLAPFEKMLNRNWKTQILNYLTDQRFEPSYLDYRSLHQGLLTGDVPMDKLLIWILQNPKQHRQYFTTALYEGLDQLPHDIPELNEFFKLVETPPAWFDSEKMSDALNFIYRLGFNSGFILRDLALMMGYLYPGLNQPLVLTGALNKNPAKRLAETTKWWMDITEPHAFNRFNPGFTSTIYVRFIHALVRHQLNKSEKWDTETWGLPINQYDQAMTNIAFSGVLLLGVRALGIFPNKREVDCFLHFWKYTGWLMGIDEKWLIDKESEGWKFLYWLPFTHPKPDATSKSLGSSLSKEPFQRQYKYLRPLQQKLAYHRHLEITQFFLGRKKMQALGLKHHSAAWFAYYLIARNAVLHTSARRFKKIDTFLLQHGRHIQKHALDLYAEDGKQLASMHQ
ncbi:oxygenase MpaB family protein [Acinetobacter sp. ANC 4648]|uniref:oxygenase MpaB family protein n=1 Tax=Acinetobacter sp. ANC 4648 TaxID=1977875 RepID=UPI000A32E296|nr:oxygenase MpaB family protein [Acinetobacter sp. ANC 4648]OTG85111.1 hypothetical protein B9T27_02565 [Acinetobacter sp. ANC 4648]